MRKLVASAFLLAATLSTACSRTTSPQLVLPALSQAIADGTDPAGVLQLISETRSVDVTDAIGATPLPYVAGLHKADPVNGASGLSRATDDAILKVLVD